MHVALGGSVVKDETGSAQCFLSANRQAFPATSNFGKTRFQHCASKFEIEWPAILSSAVKEAKICFWSASLIYVKAAETATPVPSASNGDTKLIR